MPSQKNLIKYLNLYNINVYSYEQTHLMFQYEVLLEVRKTVPGLISPERRTGGQVVCMWKTTDNAFRHVLAFKSGTLFYWIF